MPLVAAVACPHTPQLLERPETEDRARRRVMLLLTQARPDAICVLAGDHIEGEHF